MHLSALWSSSGSVNHGLVAWGAAGADAHPTAWLATAIGVDRKNNEQLSIAG